MPRTTDFNSKSFAHNGLAKTNRVFMEPDVLSAFLRYVKEVETSA
jgi:hypothetical protein